ncbi:MAG: tyrosine-type recombinase/integrase [Pseudomonadota bacterium]
MHVARYMQSRTNAKGKPAPIRATREKALLSHIFNMARTWGFTDKPNPCAGIRGKVSRRDRYITDDELKRIFVFCSPPLADAVELAYLIGQRPADVRSVLRADIQEGAIWIQQNKTGTKVRIEISERLKAVINRCVERANSFKVSSLYLVLDETGQPYNEWTLRKHWREACKAAGVTNAQFRDLRAKAGSDCEDAEAAKDLLAHENMRTTEGYLRNRRGKLVKAAR